MGDEDEGAALGLWGMSLSSTLEVEALFLEALLPLKNFMRAAALECLECRKKAVPTQGYAGYLELQRSVQRPRQ